MHNMDPVLQSGFVISRDEMRTLAAELHYEIAYHGKMIARLNDYVRSVYGDAKGGPDKIGDADKIAFETMTTDLAKSIGPMVRRLDEFADTGTVAPGVRIKTAGDYDFVARAANLERRDEEQNGSTADEV